MSWSWLLPSRTVDLRAIVGKQRLLRYPILVNHGSNFIALMEQRRVCRTRVRSVWFRMVYLSHPAGYGSSVEKDCKQIPACSEPLSPQARCCRSELQSER